MGNTDSLDVKRRLLLRTSDDERNRVYDVMLKLGGMRRQRRARAEGTETLHAVYAAGETCVSWSVLKTKE